MKETGESSYSKGNESETNPWTMMEFTDESQIASPASPDSYPPVDEEEPEPAKKSHWLQEFGSNGQMVDVSDGPSHKLKTFGGNEEEITIYDATEGMTPTPTPEPPKWNSEQ